MGLVQLILISSLLISCSDISHQDLKLVERGMSETKIVDLFGGPKDKYTDYGSDYAHKYTYYTYDIVNDSKSYKLGNHVPELTLFIIFEDSIVIGHTIRIPDGERIYLK